VLDVLLDATNIQTTFGGGFVTQINGVPKDLNAKSKSWFYYVNGVLAGVGALSYYPSNGEHIWWDYHSWDKISYFSAVIGAYPEPFRSGYEKQVLPTVILTTPEHHASAMTLAESMRKLGVKQVSVHALNDRDPSTQDAYYLIIGSWAALQTVPFVSGAYENPRKTGFSVRFTKSGRIEALDFSGAPKEVFSASAAILALNSAFSLVPCWIVVGSDTKQVEAAISLLRNSSSRIANYSGAILAKGGRGEVGELITQYHHLVVEMATATGAAGEKCLTGLDSQGHQGPPHPQRGAGAGAEADA